MTAARRRISNHQKILVGSEEHVFSALPNQVLANLRHSNSESALLWNLIYPLTQPTLALKSLMAIPPLWGTADPDFRDESIEAYFWGFNLSGERLAVLDEVLQRIDGSGPKTEIDLFLLGNMDLVLVEAKHLSGLGRCARYARRRCPEIHIKEGDLREECRYWQAGEQAFNSHLEFGSRPSAGQPSPPCNRHYQMARTLLVGVTLAKELGLRPHLWLILPRQQWRTLEKTWLDFADRVRDDRLWRCLRVFAWEDLQSNME